jgi:hypothetical protein
MVLPYFYTLSHKQHDPGGGGEVKIEHKIFVWISSTIFFQNISQTLQ